MLSAILFRYNAVHLDGDELASKVLARTAAALKHARTLDKARLSSPELSLQCSRTVSIQDTPVQIMDTVLEYAWQRKAKPVSYKRRTQARG